MTRLSMPSNRPQISTTPWSAVSASTRACVSGVPRGDIRRRGRASVAVASMARPRTSAFITMPGPPPAGVSSTVRCLSPANVRMSTTSSDHAPIANALPARLAPSGPGNISGKMVRTLARHISLTLRRELDDEPSRREIDLRHGGVVERHQFGLVAGVKPQLDQIAGAEIMDRDHGAELPPRAVDDSEPDEIGVIELVAGLRLG